MKVLVTGATGYIGAHVVKALYDRGHEIIATDFNNDQNDIKKYCEHYYDWDIREKRPDTYPQVSVNDVGVEKVVHIAAVTKVGPSVKTPWNYFSTNTVGTKNVMDAYPNKHFIYCSTGSAFQPESNPYAASKWAGELITKELCKKYSLVRFYNVSGNDGMYKFDDDVTHLVRKAAKVANRNNNHPFMPIFGVDYNTRDGTCIRNYTHVSDIVDSLIRIVESDPTNSIECLGSPKGTSVKEIIEIMKKVSGIDFKVVIEPPRDGDIEISTVPYASKFFKENKTLENICEDALKFEK